MIVQHSLIFTNFLLMLGTLTVKSASVVSQVGDPCPIDHVEIMLYSGITEGYLFNISNPLNIKNAPFVERLPVKVSISGLGVKTSDPNFRLVVTAFRKSGKFNVIFVNYGQLHTCNPIISVEKLAMCISFGLKLIFHEHKIYPNTTHLIGSSLGATLIGYLAQLFVNEKFMRITALDPAYMTTYDPCLYFTANTPYPILLNTTNFVDIHHSNMYFASDGILSGHVDIIYNSGTYQQGCEEVDSQADQLSFGSHCSHSIVNDYYAESVYTKEGFWGQPCIYSFDPYTDEKDREVCKINDRETEEILIGEHMSHTVRGLYRVNTNAFFPRAKGKQKKK